MTWEDANKKIQLITLLAEVSGGLEAVIAWNGTERPLTESQVKTLLALRERVRAQLDEMMGEE